MSRLRRASLPRFRGNLSIFFNNCKSGVSFLHFLRQKSNKKQINAKWTLPKNNDELNEENNNNNKIRPNQKIFTTFYYYYFSYSPRSSKTCTHYVRGDATATRRRRRRNYVNTYIFITHLLMWFFLFSKFQFVNLSPLQSEMRKECTSLDYLEVMCPLNF